MNGGTRPLLAGVAAMAGVVIASNILVQVPVRGAVGGLDLADILTFGAFTYPLAFLVSDLVNRAHGPARARLVAFAGFAIAIVVLLALGAFTSLVPPATVRITLASASAFALAQLLDISLFHRLRTGVWWRAPLASSVAASTLDTAVFFTLAFAAALPFAPDAFAVAREPLFGLAGAPEAPRWVSWALADLCVKLIVAGVALGPYRLALARG